LAAPSLNCNTFKAKTNPCLLGIDISKEIIEAQVGVLSLSGSWQGTTF